ncbi:MAG: hypothetical protein AB1714_11760 [Acidobacteriota bacterium]
MEIQEILADAYYSMATATGVAPPSAAPRTGRNDGCEWFEKAIGVYDALGAKSALSVATSKTLEKVRKRRDQTCGAPRDARSGSVDHQEN